MAEKEIKILRRGIPREEYVEFFRSIGEEVEPGRFAGHGWDVVVGEERGVNMMGQIMREAELIFHGEEEILADLLTRFRTKFMRA
jgi:hypothetical protein